MQQRTDGLWVDDFGTMWYDEDSGQWVLTSNRPLPVLGEPATEIERVTKTLEATGVMAVLRRSWGIGLAGLALGLLGGSYLQTVHDFSVYGWVFQGETTIEEPPDEPQEPLSDSGVVTTYSPIPALTVAPRAKLDAHRGF